MRRLPFLIALAVVAVLALVAGVLLLGESSTAQDLGLEDVAAQDLEDSGIILERPASDDRASVDEEHASEVARGRHAPGATVRQVVLAREIYVGGIQADRLVWVVSLDPDSIVPGPPSGRGLSTDPKDLTAIFALVFVDATSGEWLHSLEEVQSVAVED